MAVIRLVIWRMRRQWLSSLLLLMQMVFFFGAILIAISCVQEYTGTIRMLDSISGIDNAIYWTPDTQSLDEGGIAAADKAVLDTGGFDAIGRIATSYFIAPDGVHDVQLYNTELAQNISLPLSSGTWLRDTASGLPALVVDELMGRTYPVGSTVDAEFSLADGGHACVRFEVVGVLDMHGYIFDFSAGGNALRAGDFFNTLESYAIAYMSSVPEESMYMMWESAVLFPSALATDKQAESGRIAAMACGYIQSFASVRSMSVNSIWYQLGYLGPMSAMLAVLGLIGVAISVATSGYLNERESSVYFMCGLSRRRLCAVECLRLSIIAAFAALLTCAAGEMGLYAHYMAENSCALTLLAGWILLAAAMVCTAPYLYKHDFAKALGRD